MNILVRSMVEVLGVSARLQSRLEVQVVLIRVNARYANATALLLLHLHNSSQSNSSINDSLRGELALELSQTSIYMQRSACMRPQCWVRGVLISAVLVISALTSSAAPAQGTLSPRALQAVRSYAATMSGVKNFRVEFQAYNRLSGESIAKNRADPERAKKFPLISQNGEVFELDHKGEFVAAQGLECERINYELTYVGSKNTKNVAASNGIQTFSYNQTNNGGTRFSVDNPTNPVSLRGIGPMLGKRVTGRVPSCDMLQLFERAKSLDVEGEDAEHINIVARSDGFHDEWPVEFIVHASLGKNVGYWPVKWHIERADWGVTYASGSAGGFFQTDSFWLPKEGRFYYHQLDKINGKFVDKPLFCRLMVLDPASVRLSIDLDIDYFAPKVPDDGQLLNTITNQVEKGKNYNGASVSVTPQPGEALQPGVSRWFTYVAGFGILASLIYFIFLKRRKG